MKTIRKAEFRWKRVPLVREESAFYDSKCSGPKDVLGIVERILSVETVEVFISLSLSSQNRVIGYHEVGRGGIASCPAHPRDVYRAAIVDHAAAVVVAHNHPSGDPTPSSEDIETTKRLIEAGRILGILLLDHVVIGYGPYSMRELHPQLFQ